MAKTRLRADALNNQNRTSIALRELQLLVGAKRPGEIYDEIQLDLMVLRVRVTKTGSVKQVPIKNSPYWTSWYMSEIWELSSYYDWEPEHTIPTE